MLVRFGDERLFENSARDARLVRHDDHGEVCAVQQAYGVDAVGKEHESVEPIEVTRLLEERTVTVEKHGRTRHLAGRLAGALGRSNKPRGDRVKYLVGRDALHTPVIDWTIAQHAGTAEHLVNDDVMMTDRRGHSLVGR